MLARHLNVRAVQVSKWVRGIRPLPTVALSRVTDLVLSRDGPNSPVLEPFSPAE
jgi:hypothetical protein